MFFLRHLSAMKSRQQFLWYLKLDNFNSMLLLFPLLEFFLPSFSSLPPFFPSPPSLPCLLLLRSCNMVGISFCVVPSSINVLNKTRRVLTRRVLIDSVLPVFQFASSNSFASCSPCLICSLEYSWTTPYQNLCGSLPPFLLPSLQIMLITLNQHYEDRT